MSLIEAVLVLGCIYFIKDILALKDDIVIFFRTLRAKPKLKKKKLPKFKDVLVARTIQEQEAILCEILTDFIPTRGMLIRTLLSVRKEYLHEGHKRLFSMLLYHTKLTRNEQDMICRRYRALPSEDMDILLDYLNENREYAFQEVEGKFVHAP